MDNHTDDPLVEQNFDFVTQTLNPNNKPTVKAILIHSALFVTTYITVTFVGAIFVGLGNDMLSFGWIDLPGPNDLKRGALFAGLLLGFLGIHEFGHYFAAIYHRVKVSLPYFIPAPFGIGTLGAVIRIKERINHTKQLFDIGIAGPLAGFVVSIIILMVGFVTLPEPDFVYQLEGHEELKEYVAQFGAYPEQLPENTEEGTVLIVGNTILFSFLASFFDNVPPMWELYHYPFLFAGWLGLFFTALNLMPVGQLDGGHILYSLLGYQKHKKAAAAFFTFISVLAGIDLVPLIHSLIGNFDTDFGALSWVMWGGVLFLLTNRAFNKEVYLTYIAVPVSLVATGVLIYFFDVGSVTGSSSIWVVWLFFITYFVKVAHPPVTFYRPLSTTRKVLGWLSMLIFVLCISLNPLSIQ